jgi:hypothetical protein
MSARRGGGVEEGDSKQAGDGRRRRRQEKASGCGPAAQEDQVGVGVSMAAAGGRLFLRVGGARRIGRWISGLP